jgi:hypothetical protein
MKMGYVLKGVIFLWATDDKNYSLDLKRGTWGGGA